MSLIIASITTTLVNLIIFLAVPFLWWFFRHRKEITFFRWIGLYRPRLHGKWWVLLIFAAVYYFFYNFDFTIFINPDTLAYLESSGSVSANVYAGLGFAAVLPALIENFLANGLCEEILYRGFLCKRLCHRLGTINGIIIQAILFGAMHNILYIAAGLQVGIAYHALLFLFTATAALLLGWLNEKIYNGSILPGILLHGAGNFISSLLIAFSLM